VPDSDREEVRWRRTGLLYYLKRPAQALAEVGPAEKTFRQLARRFIEDNDADGLARLVADRAGAPTADPAVGYFRAEVHFLNGEYAAAADLFAAYRRAAGPTTDDPHPVWSGERQFRCRIRLGELAAARAVLPSSGIGPHVDKAVELLRQSGHSDELPRGLQLRACLRHIAGNCAGSQSDLDEAWDIAERGSMRLHIADIHLPRARLFFRESCYPWGSPRDDLAAAEMLIDDCGYHRRDEELADAKAAIP
jgi:hypothetical protein